MRSETDAVWWPRGDVRSETDASWWPQWDVRSETEAHCWPRWDVRSKVRPPRGTRWDVPSEREASWWPRWDARSEGKPPGGLGGMCGARRKPPGGLGGMRGAKRRPPWWRRWAVRSETEASVGCAERTEAPWWPRWDVRSKRLIIYSSQKLIHEIYVFWIIEMWILRKQTLNAREPKLLFVCLFCPFCAIYLRLPTLRKKHWLILCTAEPHECIHCPVSVRDAGATHSSKPERF